MAALDTGRVIGSCPVLETISVAPSAPRAPSAIPRISGVLSPKCAHSKMTSSAERHCRRCGYANAQRRGQRSTACPSVGSDPSTP